MLWYKKRTTGRNTAGARARTRPMLPAEALYPVLTNQMELRRLY